MEQENIDPYEEFYLNSISAEQNKRKDELSQVQTEHLYYRSLEPEKFPALQSIDISESSKGITRKRGVDDNLKSSCPSENDGKKKRMG
ncbi:hypothetical protein KAFR_0G00770 [Kazachstania africana CBS 2517]|uniref:Uncharacterized protein n=1 Tax=Kazachstania africana (strain ATCC 22294 / BCRC 22015 / CBS 2517 / CECT 1963 / NBRC 1671 / NRRL Y-8276) TaxID=1071382 RepID=H2AXL0_KAZAF|nr:hypothetical protein KAFR_0G00770 [Kazachstania africana CBS 2517]CCF59110.1 hypothetical protein KAFR_0G00770 [Kazachstania africana CBS 2517]